MGISREWKVSVEVLHCKLTCKYREENAQGFMDIRATSHTRLRACDHHTSGTLRATSHTSQEP